MEREGGGRVGKSKEEKGWSTVEVVRGVTKMSKRDVLENG